MAELALLDQPGGRVWVAEAPNWTNEKERGDTLLIGINPGAFDRRLNRGQRWILGQMHGVVGTGLIFTEHVFKGLKRDMYVRKDRDAAKNKLALTWKAGRDAYLVGPAHDCRVEFHPAAPGTVFAVYISINAMLKDFPAIYGWAEHWTWIDDDPDVVGAPIDWQDRYDEQLWRKE